ncbi:conserved hypothetical protein [Sphingobacterium multivorum]|uniref:Uncharacterized protein n=1 Tax=Sphingobacterium multivorum TaxID=28454 RepID=A0A653YZV8_SPHMU|nr:conserved hypothetical protein [Sphingobacterium multivorum]
MLKGSLSMKDDFSMSLQNYKYRTLNQTKKKIVGSTIMNQLLPVIILLVEKNDDRKQLIVSSNIHKFI